MDTHHGRPRGVLAALRAGLGATDDEHRATSLELLFDLVFVFAITQVTGLMEHNDLTGTTVVEAVITLLVVWFGWCAYTWLGNQARADGGVVRIGLIVAMAGMFFVAVSIPHSFDAEGSAAVVLVVAYAVVRLTHIGVYLVAAGDDRALRSVVLAMAAVCAVLLGLLGIGVAAGPPAQKWWWLAAVAADQVGVYVIGSTRWRVYSASHFAERFGLIVLIAIGESIVATGAATSVADIGWRDLAALLCGLAIAICLWWLYFDRTAERTEAALRAADPRTRVRLARDSYTYIHLTIVGGVVFAATGVARLIGAGSGHADGGGHDAHGAAARAALYCGVAAYLAGTVLFRLRSNHEHEPVRTIGAAVLVALVPIVGALDPRGQLGVCAAVLLVITAADARRGRRQARSPSGVAGPARGHAG